MTGTLPLAFPLPANAALARFGGSLLPATLGESLGAAAADPRLRPTELIARQALIAGDEPHDADIEAGLYIGPPPERPPSQLEGPDTLNEEFKDLGLKFDRPMRRDAADAIAEGKRADMIRADIVARAPQGAAAGAARLGVSFLAAAVDPLNVASAFVPVVSQARFAGMIARYGVAGGRFARGAVEGAAGNLMLEPIAFGLSREQQLDYTMADALVNVAFGGLLGGGLHVGAGKIGDLIARRSEAEREAAFRAAVAQSADGRRVDVDAFLAGARDPGPIRDSFDPRIFDAPEPAPRNQGLFSARPTQAVAIEGTWTGQGTGARLSDYTLPPADARWVDAVVAELQDARPGHRVFIDNPDGPGQTVIGVPAETPAWFQNANKRIEERRKERAAAKKANPGGPEKDLPAVGTTLTRAKVEAVADKMARREPLGPAEHEVALEILAAARAMREQNARGMAEFRAGREARAEADDRASIDALARREAEWSRDDLADVDASARAEADAGGLARAEGTSESGIEKSIADDIAGATVRLDAYRAGERGGLARAEGTSKIAREIETELARVAEAEATAKSYARAAEAAALCLSRVG